MVNWQEAGKTWPLPHPHAVRVLRGFGMGAALPPQQSRVRRRHARELRAPRGHGRRLPAGSGRLAAGGRIRLPLPPEALEGLDPPRQTQRRAAP